MKFLRNISLIILSALLLVLAFPKTDLWFLSWIALIPLFIALDDKTWGRSFGIGYLWGLFFFGGTLFWIGRVTIEGTCLLVAYLALYPALFAVGYSVFRKYPDQFKLILYPSLWVGTEYIRSHLFTGFGWSTLGLSQYKALWLIQIADVVGVYGISFLIVLVNLWVKRFRYFSPKCFWPALLIIGVLIYGYIRPASFKSFYWQQPSIRVGMVQANIPQEIKWNDNFWPQIMKKYLRLTNVVIKEDPDLIIWPEASFPGFLWEDEDDLELVKELVRKSQRPLLFGSVMDDGKDYFNSAILLSKDAQPIGQYDKMHLVPFGEFLPLRPIFPFLEDIIPIGDFTRGKDFKIFSLPETKGHTFSILICFEDTVPHLVRRFVKDGAELLINISNDAWFGDSQEPFMHLQSTVFRAIENRRMLVRVANTGVSTIINPMGEIQSSIKDENGKTTYIEGTLVEKVYFNNTKTLYTKFGDLFTFLCFGCILGAILKGVRR